MKLIHRLPILLLAAVFIPGIAMTQAEWPRTIVTSDGGSIDIYQIQPDSFRENVLRFRAAFTFYGKGKDSAKFGSFQACSRVAIDKDNRQVNLLLTTVISMRLAVLADSPKLEYLKEAIESGSPSAVVNIPLDELLCFPCLNEEDSLPPVLKNNPPEIILAGNPTLLVLIDGIPRLRKNGDWGVNEVVNSPYVIVESYDGWFYLYGGRHWYIGPTPTGPFNYTRDIPSDMSRIGKDINSSFVPTSGPPDTVGENADMIREIVVRTSPAEIILTRGKPVLTTISGTGLLYVSNSDNDLFLDSAAHRYFVLLSGRWFHAPSLSGPWIYITSDSLPAGFARIPEGSPKDRVLACVAGTAAATEALTDARLPQTAAINRAMATTTVSYEGNPIFADIRGTHLQFARNTPSLVLRDKFRYFCVDRAVWFSSDNPGGPWTAATERPDGVSLIPADCPVYNCKFVQIYSFTASTVYTGYTSGYLNTYASGQTLVYGTGYAYPYWAGKPCYIQPWTWGFNMWYNPWFGWTLGDDFSLDWFYTGSRDRGYWNSGWWGSPAYRPASISHHVTSRGIANRGVNSQSIASRGIYEKEFPQTTNINYSNNLYHDRPDLMTTPAVGLYYAGDDGVVYHKDGQGHWWERKENKWEKTDDNLPAAVEQLDRQQRLRQRGWMRLRNFRQQRS